MVRPSGAPGRLRDHDIAARGYGVRLAELLPAGHLHVEEVDLAVRRAHRTFRIQEHAGVPDEVPAGHLLGESPRGAARRPAPRAVSRMAVRIGPALLPSSGSARASLWSLSEPRYAKFSGRPTKRAPASAAALTTSLARVRLSATSSVEESCAAATQRLMGRNLAFAAETIPRQRLPFASYRNP
jgi:hypothetical protein